MIIYEKMNQRSDAWSKIRIGKLTASQASKIHARGSGLETLCQELAYEKRTGKKKYIPITDAMEMGIKLEPIARALFEKEMNLKVKEVGFVEEDEFCGCSPDGLIGNDCGIEIKCPQANTYRKYLNDNKVDPRYYAQIQMNMLLTERSSWWYVVYNPSFPQPMIVKKIYADKKYQEELRLGIEKGKSRIKEILGIRQNKILYIIRGAPGSGKTTLAHKLTNNVAEADMFMYENDTYVWKPEKLRIAHKKCFEKIRKYIENGITPIAVSNTFIKIKDYMPYKELAEKFGYQVEIKTCHGEYKNIHNVPEWKVQEMRRELETSDVSECFTSHPSTSLHSNSQSSFATYTTTIKNDNYANDNIVNSNTKDDETCGFGEFLIKIFLIYFIVSIIMALAQHNEVKSTPKRQYSTPNIQRRATIKVNTNDTSLQREKNKSNTPKANVRDIVLLRNKLESSSSVSEHRKQYFYEHQPNVVIVEDTPKHNTHKRETNNNLEPSKNIHNDTLQKHHNSFENMQNVEIITYNTTNRTYTITKP